MKVTIFGSGYVGLVTGACLAEVGNDVLCVDVDQRKVDMLQHGEIPIYEPGLDDLVNRNASSGRLAFSTEVAQGVAHGLFQFIAVGTPPDEDGSADLQHVLGVGKFLLQHVENGLLILRAGFGEGFHVLPSGKGLAIERPPTIDGNHLPAGVVGIANQEQRGAGNIPGLALALEKGARDDALLGDFIDFPLRPQNGAGGDGVDAYIRTQFAGQGFGEHHQSRLGDAVHGEAFQRPIGVDVRNVDDTAAAFLEMWCRGL